MWKRVAMVIVNSKHETCPSAPSAPLEIKFKRPPSLQVSTSKFQGCGNLSAMRTSGIDQPIADQVSHMLKPALSIREHGTEFNSFEHPPLHRVPMTSTHFPESQGPHVHGNGW